MWVLVNIGCIECGVSSNVVGVYADKDAAERDADILRDRLDWREGGQNGYVVFPLPEPGVIDAEYRKALAEVR